MSSEDESDAEPMHTDMLEDIRDGSQSCSIINKIEVRYKICDHSERGQVEWKGVLLSMQNMGKGLYKLFKAVVMRFFKIYKFWVIWIIRFLPRSRT